MPPVNDTGVLAGLADIPWAELRHAYGSADDVPAPSRRRRSSPWIARLPRVSPIEALVSHLVAAVATPGGRNQLLALGLVGETSRQWPAAITATVREQLSVLAERPRRAVTFGSYDQIIRDDEALRAEIRRFLANSEKFSGVREQ